MRVFLKRVEIKPRDGLLYLEENRTYEVTVPVGPHHNAVSFSGRPLESRGRSRGTFVLRIEQWVGEGELQGPEALRLLVCVKPREDKRFQYEVWCSLLRDLERWLPGVCPGSAGGLLGGAVERGAAAPLLLQALLPQVSTLEAAVRRLAHTPRTRRGAHLEDVPLRLVRRVDQSVVRQLLRDPQARGALDPWAEAEAEEHLEKIAEPHVRQWRLCETHKHPVNGYLAGLFSQVADAFTQLAGDLEKVAEEDDLGGTKTWATHRGELAKRAGERIRRLLSLPPFKGARHQELTDGVLHALRGDPRYGLVAALCRRFLEVRFALQESPSTVPVKPSYSLYELWAFLATRDCLAVALGLPMGALLRNDLGERTHIDNGDSVVLELPEGRLELFYNREFCSWGKKPRRSGPHSLNTKRRPDLVITWMPKAGGSPAWLCLDAKFYEAGGLAKALEKLHFYRDALCWPEFGGRCRGGLLLVPSAPGTRAWHEPGFWQEYGLGVYPLQPGREHAGLALWILKTLAVPGWG